MTLLCKAVFISHFLNCVNKESWLIIMDNFNAHTTLYFRIVLKLNFFIISSTTYSIDLCILLKTRQSLFLHIQNDHRIMPSVKRHNSHENYFLFFFIILVRVYKTHDNTRYYGDTALRYWKEPDDVILTREHSSQQSSCSRLWLLCWLFVLMRVINGTSRESRHEKENALREHRLD